MTHPKPDGLDALKQPTTGMQPACSRSKAWREGWNDCIDHLAQRGMLNCGWMPADEAPYDTMCLFYTKDGHVVQGFIYDGGAEDYGYSHYMPLPAAPKMEGME